MLAKFLNKQSHKYNREILSENIACEFRFENTKLEMAKTRIRVPQGKAKLVKEDLVATSKVSDALSASFLAHHRGVKPPLLPYQVLIFFCGSTIHKT